MSVNGGAPLDLIQEQPDKGTEDSSVAYSFPYDKVAPYLGLLA